MISFLLTCLLERIRNKQRRYLIRLTQFLLCLFYVTETISKFINLVIKKGMPLCLAHYNDIPSPILLKKPYKICYDKLFSPCIKEICNVIDNGEYIWNDPIKICRN